MTLNSDFSNVENDQVVTSPQEFRYQYAEYRPFFTQGASYLPSSEVFYSPSIGIFDSGEKIEGGVGRYGIGILNVDGFRTTDQVYSLSYNSANQEFYSSVQGSQSDRPGGGDGVVEANISDANKYSRIFYGASIAQEYGSFTRDSAQALRSGAYAGVNEPNYSLQMNYLSVGPEYHPSDAYVAVKSQLCCNFRFIDRVSS